MRHYNPVIRSPWRGTIKIKDRPYERPYTYARPSMKCKYVQILDYVANHPGCKRFDIICDVWHFSRELNTPKTLRGQCSLTFSNLLYDDLLDYDSHFRYTVTPKGMAILNLAKRSSNEA